MEPIFHIASATDWHAAQASSEYRISTRGRTLQEEGFIHCSYADQVCRVANAFYRGMDGLVLLVIDRSRVRAEVRDETSGGDERFPHMYGPLNIDAVIDVLPFEPLGDGTFENPWSPEL